MPELGKATYWLEMNTAEFKAGMASAEATAATTTTAIDGSMTKASASVERLGAASTQTASAVTAADTRIAAANERVGASAVAMGNKSEKAGKKALKWAGLLAIGIGYLGFKEMNEAAKAQRLVANAVETTGGVAGVTAGHVEELAAKWAKLTGVQDEVTMGLAQLLLRFTNIRNVGVGADAVFDRTLTAINNISAATGRSTQSIAIALGKAMQDPVKYIAILGRSGITFRKSEIAQVQMLARTGRGFEAQKLLLDSIESRYGGLTKSADLYGGAAQEAAKTTEGQFKIAWQQMREASRTIVVEFVPAFKTIVKVVAGAAGVMSRHRQMLKYIVIGLVAWKAALIVGGIWATATKAWIGMSLALRGVAAGEAAVTTAAAPMRAATFALGSPAILGAVAALAGGYRLLQKAASAANKEISALDQVATPERQELQFYAMRTKLWVKRGLSPANARAKASTETAAMAKRTGLPEWKGSRTFGAGVDEGAADKPTNFSTAGGAGTAKSALDRLQASRSYKLATLAVLQATLTKSNKDDIQALRAQETILRGLLSSKKLTLNDRIVLTQELSGVDSQLQSLLTKAVKAKKAWKLPNRFDIAISKAEQTAALKDDIKAYDMERKYLEDLLKGAKANTDKYAKLQRELANVDKKLRALKKEEARRKKEMADATRKEIQATRDLRGTFFGQFAGSVFHQTAGGLAMGAGASRTAPQVPGKSVTVHQTNQYHEIPKDKHAEARRMAKATQAAMA